MNPTTGTTHHQPHSIPPGPRQRFGGQPYLQCLESFENSFPALKSFLNDISNEINHDRKVVETHYRKHHQRGPGRCFCLKFDDSGVSVVEKDGFKSPDSLREYLDKNPAKESREINKDRRLFILEDMESGYVDTLGHHLGVDPLVFSEQTNTWNFTDSVSIPHRGLPSMSVPEQSFTLRYYELRTLLDPKSIDTLSLQMTFALNKRRYERWRDVDVLSSKPDRRHAFVRRCASFWTSQDATDEIDMSDDALGWDAVILVDPAFMASCTKTPTTVGNSEPVANGGMLQAPSLSAASSAATEAAMLPGSTNVVTPRFSPDGFEKTSPAVAVSTTVSYGSRNDGLEQCLILKKQAMHPDRAALWKAEDVGIPLQLEATDHKSWPYHQGCSTLAPLLFSQVGIGSEEVEKRKFRNKRDLVSPLGEMVFCWTKLATPKLVKYTVKRSSNATYYLLKHIAQHWVNQLELINTTIAKGEWFADDYQAQIDDNLSLQKWKSDLIKVNEIAKDINYMRRHLNHFCGAMALNLERLGVQLGAESVDERMSHALRDAQKDFLTIKTRMQPLRDRAEALGSVSNDLANLRAAFRGVHDSEFSLRISLFASIVFPLTLVAGIFSMGDDYRPGKPQFWKLWAIGPPLCVALALGLVYGRRPWRVFTDIAYFVVIWLKDHGYIESNEPQFERKRQNLNQKERKSKKVEIKRRDEESGD